MELCQERQRNPGISVVGFIVVAFIISISSVLLFLEYETTGVLSRFMLLFGSTEMLCANVLSFCLVWEIFSTKHRTGGLPEYIMEKVCAIVVIIFSGAANIMGTAFMYQQTRIAMCLVFVPAIILNLIAIITTWGKFRSEEAKNPWLENMDFAIFALLLSFILPIVCFVWEVR